MLLSQQLIRTLQRINMTNRILLHKGIVIFFFLIISFKGQGQNLLMDSLKQELLTTTQKEKKAEILLKLCNYYKDISLDTVKVYLEETRLLLEDIDPSEKVHRIYAVASAQLNSDEGRVNEAILILKDAEKQAIEYSDADMLLSIKQRLADALLSDRKYDLAIEQAIEILKLVESNPSKKQKAKALSLLAGAYRRVGQLDKAEEHFKNSIDLYKEIGDSSNVVAQMANYAILSGVKNGGESALDLFKETLRYGGSSIKPLFRSKLNKDIAMSAALLGQKDTAYHYIGRAIEIAKGFNIQQFDVDLLMSKSLIYVKTGRCNEVFPILDEVAAIAKETNNTRWKSMVLQLRTDCLTELNRHQEASAIFKERLKLKDTLFQKNLADAIADADVKYESEKKEAEIKQLSLEDELNKERLYRQRFALSGSIGGLGILSFLLYRIFGQKRKIQDQNLLIAKNLSEKEVLLKEIHHRVKNNLQVISSLLGMQSLSIKDDHAKSAIQEGRSRVHSMSLIHQYLYKEDQLTGVPMANYVKKLCNDLIRTYQVGDTQITLYEEIDEDLVLDVETVVPMGLIINELMTNTLKYAFIGRSKGLITVKLNEQEDQLKLEVNDNGVGMDVDQSNSDSFGLRLVNSFKQKLDADVDIASDIKGTAVNLTIRKYKKS